MCTRQRWKMIVVNTELFSFFPFFFECASNRIVQEVGGKEKSSEIFCECKMVFHLKAIKLFHRVGMTSFAAFLILRVFPQKDF